MGWKASVEEAATAIAEDEFDAEVTGVRDMEGQHGPMVRVEFSLSTDDEWDGRYVTGLASKKLSAATKLGRWLEAILGHMPTAIGTRLIRRIFERYRLPYLSLTPTFSICPNHGYLCGEHAACPNCGAEAEVWSRVTGYFRPVANFNEGKKQEYRDRVKFVLPTLSEGKA